MASHQRLLDWLGIGIDDPSRECRSLYSARERRELQRLERACLRLRTRMLASRGWNPGNCL